jgi:IS605 OrfB family transposase
MNHQLSRAVVQFAEEQGAGVIQMEDLGGLQDVLRGSFVGARWRYEELQRFIQYKGEEAGIEVRKVEAKHTSRRCSKCGYINAGFTREHRDRMRSGGMSVRYECVNPDCRDECNKYPLDADYNAARNISTIDIEREIRVQCKKQGIAYE